MENRLFESRLPNHKIFKDLKVCPNDRSSTKLRNLLELKDDMLYVWNPVENYLMSLNLKHLEEKDEETLYQKLHFLAPPPFSVERIMASSCGSKICVWGSRGVTIAQLPSRWGRGELFDTGNPTVLCNSYSLDERFLYSQGEVRRVHWHPSSLSHLLVLVSDNTIRLYNIALKTGPKMVKMYSVGPKPTAQLAGRAILDSLGDTAVDFALDPDSESLLILRGNGDIYMMQCDLDSKSKPSLRGPLAMFPPADDNYGSESCALATLGGGDAPTLIAVATCAADIYHCLLLPNANENEDGDTHSLYVVDAVELNIPLSPDYDMDLQYSYPVHLYPCSSNSYVCVHASGVHSVTLPVLQRLKQYAEADEGMMEAVLVAMAACRSTARHLVQTVAPPAPPTPVVSSSLVLSSPPRPSPPLGVALTAPPLPRALVLCADGDSNNLLTRTLEPFDLEETLLKEIQLKNPALEQSDVNKLLKDTQKLSFTSILQEILTREDSQPILSISKAEEPTVKENLELVTQATLKLRTEYMSRQQRASDALSRKLHALRTLATQHTHWDAMLQKDLEDVELQSAVLKEKCALAAKYQDDLKYRCSTVIRNIRSSSATTPAERELLASLTEHKRSADLYAQQIQALKEHLRRKTDEREKWQEEYKRKDIALGKSHSDTISSILQQQTSQISTLIEETKILKDQLSIV